MLRHLWLSHAQTLHDVADGVRPEPQQFDDPEPARLTESAEHRFHGDREAGSYIPAKEYIMVSVIYRQTSSRWLKCVILSCHTLTYDIRDLAEWALIGALRGA